MLIVSVDHLSPVQRYYCPHAVPLIMTYSFHSWKPYLPLLGTHFAHPPTASHWQPLVLFDLGVCFSLIFIPLFFFRFHT